MDIAEMILDRRTFLTAASLMAAGGCSHALGDVGPGPVVAISIDDFQMNDGPLMTGPAKHRAILDALETAGLQAGGFVAGRHVQDASSRRLLGQWAEAGHAVANHTHSHAYYGGSSPGDLGADIDQAADLIASYPTVRPWFRFPYLAEGRTAENRDHMRNVLRQRGLMNGHVTIDASDWYVNQRLVDRLRVEPATDPDPYGRYLVRHLLDRAVFYDGLARSVLSYSPPHVLLLHHNLTTALFLPRIIDAFQQEGWSFVSIDRAFSHPLYRSQPDIAPAAHSLIWQLAKADGRFDAQLRSPGEDGVYEKPFMDALGL